MRKRNRFRFGRFHTTRPRLSRRGVLRGSGVAMSLPWLSAMQAAGAASGPSTPRRFVSVSLGLGLLGDNLFPKQPGKSYEASRYLQSLQDLRDQFTVVSGSSHPDVSNGHRAEASILTATPIGNSGSARNTISVDQYLAKHLGDETRFPSLVLSTSGTQSPSYTDTGAMIPAESSPSRLFAQLFIDDTQQERLRQAERIRNGRSIMDIVHDDAQRLQRELGADDRNRLDAYFTSVRELEQRMAANERWAKLPKPKIDREPPKPLDANDMVGSQALMLDIMKLALRTDSTRFISLHLPGNNIKVPIQGVEQGYHSLSHHGRDEEKLAQLALIEEQIVGAWGDFLRSLAGIEETDGTLLDNTAVLMTSNLGNASSHDNRNMPVIFGGGGFAHGQHLAFDRDNNYPLANLFVSVLQQCGLPSAEFSSGKSTMTGLEPNAV
ncbi:DUF1552 domain-containing protein [Roseiconus nitratireducens]|uniref:DUF1552 domain-containing protein n=1 Tax=Roseiconus nitratireducens TaxID=2605748 RepID=A0A5M6CXW4_9BACT|nr:DUF1552 domain-containing protein [Roseiconus nitratireducens]KAA5540057.1 DUF1552 domain-containing protein [Roseiconus nitratireducens]